MDSRIKIIEDYYNNPREEILTSSYKPYITRDLAFDDYIKILKEDPNYRYISRNASIAIDIYSHIKKVVNEDPNFRYMKPYIDRSMTCYSVFSLMFTLSTLNPMTIMFALYKLP